MLNDIREIILKLESHRHWIETTGKLGKRLGVDEIDLRDVDLSVYPLEQADFTSCIFDGMNLKHNDFSSSLLCSSTFITANLEGVDFCKSNISYVDFTGANIKAARLADSECIESVFVASDLSDANLVAGLFDKTDFRNATLINADIRLATFEGVLLMGAKLTGIRGIEEAFITSINVGTPDKPEILFGQDAKNWLQVNCLNN